MLPGMDAPHGSDGAPDDRDAFFMREALAEAALGEGGTRPNPPVGAVLVKDGRIVARGRHRRAGGAHAEADCLSRAGTGARGATLYATLEPCSAPGRVGPCTEAIVAAGVSRVVFAAQDANPRNSGRAAEILRAAGIEVEAGVLRREAEAMLEPFFKHVSTGLPFVTLKMAQSLDGAVADHAGVSKWITGAESRAEVARLRRRADVVFAGSGTVLADDPSLLRRDEPEGGLPGMRCVLDARGRIPATAKVFSDGAAERTIVATTRLCPTETAARWRDAGAAVWELPTAFPEGTQGRGGAAPAIDLGALFRRFGEEGFMHALCEGGAALASSLVAESLVDELQLFVAPVVLGGGSLGTFGAFPHDLPTAPRFALVSQDRFGGDLRLVLRPRGAKHGG